MWVLPNILIELTWPERRWGGMEEKRNGGERKEEVEGREREGEMKQFESVL